MMGVAKLSAGDGYAYYLSRTVSADVTRDRDASLVDYYLDTGTPPGVWMGSGIDTLGVSGEVTEDQMRNLFGNGWHPDATPTMAAMIGAGASEKEAEKWAQLGRKAARYQTPSSQLSRALTDAVKAAEAANGGVLDAGQRRAVRMRTAAIAYREKHGHEPASPKELSRWIGQELKGGQQAVAGYDLTFSAPKSVSVVWATADADTSKAVERAHETALAEAVAYLEQNAMCGRVGTGGAHTVAVEGVVGTRFRHWTSREGDPQLHDHLVIANKVRRAGLDPNTPDTEGWVTVDGASLYRHVQSASAVYDRALSEQMRGLGFHMENRAAPGERKLRMEVAGISDETITQFSGRRQQITAKTNELIQRWESDNGREADTWTRNRLAQEATLATRSPKEHTIPFAELVAKSRQRLRQAVPLASPYVALARPRIDAEKAATGILEDLSGRRATWNQAHLDTAVELWAAASGASPDSIAQVRDQIARRSVCLTPEGTMPEVLRPAVQTRWFTTRAVMDAESTVLDAADQLIIPRVTPAGFDAAVAAHVGALDEGQIALARTFATGERLVEAGIGPAGAGKTTAMRLTVEAVEQSGHRVVGLATSARAADVFAEETGAYASSLAMWITQRQGNKVPAEYRLNAGDVLVVDEASMASSRHLAAVVEDARRHGAVVRLLGDPAQLGAVESGGLLRELDRRHGATRLETLWRFRDMAEANATLSLATQGDVSWYQANDRIHGVTAPDLAATVMGQWFERTQAGRDVAVMASSNSEVHELNNAAQQIMLDHGLVDHTRTARLRGGAVAGIGDTILTRNVDRSLVTSDRRSYVHNGDRWTVAGIKRNGSIEAVNSDTGRRVTLPAKYLAKHTTLGYASTVHIAQGRTADEALMVVSDRVDRQSLYVGMSRGRDRNDAFVGLSGRSAAEVVEAAARRVSVSVSAHELIAQQQAAVDDPATAIGAFHVVVAETDRARYNTQIRDAYARLYGPGREVEAATAADVLIGTDSRAALDNALRRGEAAGFSVDRLIAATAPDTITDAADPGRVVAWRIDRHLARATATSDTVPTARPLENLSDTQLAELAQRTTAERAAAQLAVRDATRLARIEPAPVTLKDGTTAPAWTDRQHGHLTGDELAAAMDDALAAVTYSTQDVRDARDELTAARREWAQMNVPGQRMHPQTIGAADRLTQAEATLDAAQETDRITRSEYADLRAEKQLRWRMTPKSWGQENRSRETAAARQAMPDTPDRYTDPAEAQRHRYATHTDADQAHTRYQQARIIDAQVRAEQTARLRTPDMAPPSRLGLPTWAGASNALHHDSVPAERRDQLTQAARWIQQQMNNRGEALALDPSRQPWTRELGPVPTDPELRTRWTQLAGRIDTYRRLNGYDQPDRSLPTPGTNTRQRVEIHTLRAAMSDLRHDTTPPETDTPPINRTSIDTSPWTTLRGRDPRTTGTATLDRTTPQLDTDQQTLRTLDTADAVDADTMDADEFDTEAETQQIERDDELNAQAETAEQDRRIAQEDQEQAEIDAVDADAVDADAVDADTDRADAQDAEDADEDRAATLLAVAAGMEEAAVQEAPAAKPLTVRERLQAIAQRQNNRTNQPTQPDQPTTRAGEHPISQGRRAPRR